MQPRREVFYVRTTVRLIDPDRNQALEHDFLAIRVELARLWLLFVATFLGVAFLVVFAAGGPMKFSFLNWIFSSQYGFVTFAVCQYPPLLVLVLLSAWISEQRVLRDAEACSARSSPSLTRALGELREFPIFSWESTESISRRAACRVLPLADWANERKLRTLPSISFETGTRTSTQSSAKPVMG
jgi:hypothetical protein